MMMTANDQLYIGPDLVVRLVRDFLGSNDLLSQIHVSLFFHEDIPGLTELTIKGNGATGMGIDSIQSTGLETIKIPASVRSIGPGVFNKYEHLQSVILQEGLVDMEETCFGDCTRLHEIKIPSTVRNIKRRTFYNCTALKKVEFVVVEDMIMGATNISRGQQLLPPVVEIGDGAFQQCSSLEAINIPSSVKSLGAYVFYRCTSLKAITIPPSLEDIPEGAFSDCNQLTSVTLHDGLQTIGDQAFRRCGFEHIDIPSTVTKIGVASFMACESLVHVELPPSLEELGMGSFMCCRALKSVNIRKGKLKELPSRLFYDCRALEDVCLPNGMTLP